MTARRIAAVVFGGLAVGVALGVWWLEPRLEWGVPHPPWADPLPEHAVEKGYASFYRWRGGPVWRAWEEDALDAHPPRPDGPLLLDTVHTSKQRWDLALAMDAYGYSQMHGYAAAFAPIVDAGVDVQPVSWRWSGRTLGGASAVFVNLPSGDNGALRASEVVALESFVRRGGGLVLVTDHSNCYFHAELLEPLTEALGITLPPVTAADPVRRLTRHSVSWIRVYADNPHPVMAGVRLFALMTAGAIEGLPALATTSDEGWWDRWEPYRKEESAGFTGDLVRQADERAGPVPVIAAGEHGAGRVVVLGDQNAWGATLIGYEDNARLFTNAIAWAMGRDLPAPGRDAGTVTTVVGDGIPTCTDVTASGYRTLEVQSQRWAAHTGRREACTAGDVGRSGAVIILPQPARPDLDVLLSRPALVVLDPDAGITDPVLDRLGLRRGTADARAASIRWVADRPAPDVPLLHVGADTLDATPMAVEGPLDVWVSDSLGRPVVGVVGDVILVLDSALLANPALGKERDDPRKGVPAGGSSRALAAHRLAHRLLAELYTR